MLKTTIVIATMSTMGLFSVVSDFQRGLPIPVEIGKEDPRLTDTRDTLRILGRDVKNAKAVFFTAIAKDINPVFWACNIECESDFVITARSPKGYKGLGQTPKAIMKLGYEEADLMAAACVFAEKRKIAKGNIPLAWALYKGGDNPAAHREAEKVYALYEKVTKQLKEKQG